MRRTVTLSFSGPYLPSILANQRRMPPISQRNPTKKSFAFHDSTTTMIASRNQDDEPIGNRLILLDKDAPITDSKLKESFYNLPTFQNSENVTHPTPSLLQNLVQKIGIPTDAILLLNLLTIIWGSQHAIIDIFMCKILLWCSFGNASLAEIIQQFQNRKRNQTRKTLE
jgi:hypothetical protein